MMRSPGVGNDRASSGLIAQGEDSLIAETEFRMLGGLDHLWRKMRPTVRGHLWVPPADPEAQENYAEFVQRIPAHPALLMFPRTVVAGDPVVGVSRQEGEWQIVSGIECRDECLRRGALPSLFEHGLLDPIALIAEKNAVLLGSEGECLWTAVELMYIVMRRGSAQRVVELTKRARMPTKRARLKAAAVISRAFGRRAGEIEAAAFVEEHGIAELWKAVFDSHGDEPGFVEPLDAAKVAAFPPDVQRAVVEAGRRSWARRLTSGARGPWPLDAEQLDIVNAARRTRRKVAPRPLA